MAIKKNMVKLNMKPQDLMPYQKVIQNINQLLMLFQEKMAHILK